MIRDSSVVSRHVKSHILTKKLELLDLDVEHQVLLKSNFKNSVPFKGQK